MDKYIIIGSVNKKYLKIFKIWYHYFSKLGIKENLLIISFDNESKIELEKLGIGHYQLEQKVRRQEIVFIRLGIIRGYLEKGFTVIHTDIDAFWLKNPLPLFENSKYDIQISIGHGRPTWVLNDWGFTLCCGLFAIRSNDATLGLVETWQGEIEQYQSDQTALNDIIRRNGMPWELNSIYENEGYCKNLNLRIQAIDYSLVTRGMDKRHLINNDKVIVFHPYLSDESHQLKLMDALRNLIKLDPDPKLKKLQLRAKIDIFSWIENFPIITQTAIKKIVERLKRMGKKLLLNHSPNS